MWQHGTVAERMVTLAGRVRIMAAMRGGGGRKCHALAVGYATMAVAAAISS